MGVQHALGGAAVWLAATPALDAAYGLTPGQVAVGTVIAAGAAMVPDLDQHGSTIGRTYGPVTNVLARIIALVSGGHRNGTHSLLGVAAFTGVAWLAVAHGGWLRFVLLWILLGVACRAAGLAIPGHRSVTAVLHAVSMGVVTLIALASGVGLAVPLIAGTALGVVSHLAEDMLTPQGCPLLWPISKARHGVGLVTTGSRWTSPLLTAGLVALVVVLAWSLTPADVYLEAVTRLVVGA